MGVSPLPGEAGRGGKAKEGSLEDNLVLLIGSPRSGSTLLSRMLGAHSQVHAPAEPHLLTPLAYLGYYGRVDKAEYDTIITGRAAQELVAGLEGGEAAYLEALRAYTDAIYRGLLAPSGCSVLLDKTPAYALVLDFVARLYPKARYVVLTRNPLAVWSSFVDSFFDGDHQEAHAWNPLLERYVPAVARFVREARVPMCHVRYEDVVTDPDAQMKRICEFAGLAFEPEMVDYGDAEGGSRQAAAGLGDPIGVASQTRPTTRSLERWTTSLAGRPEKVAQCREILAQLCDPDLETWGFDRAALESQLAGIDPAAAGPGRSKRTRYALQRKLLVALRRNIHHNALGRGVRRLREACDILLR